MKVLKACMGRLKASPTSGLSETDEHLVMRSLQGQAGWGSKQSHLDKESLLTAGGWNSWPLKVPSNLNHSVIFLLFMLHLVNLYRMCSQQGAFALAARDSPDTPAHPVIIGNE